MTYYVKQGRRYVPVGEDIPYDCRPNGAWLLVVSPGETSWRRVDAGAGRLELIDGARAAVPAMVEALREARLPHPWPEKLTPKQRAAWQAFKAVMGEADPRLVSDSLSDVAEAGVAALVKSVVKAEVQP